MELLNWDFLMLDHISAWLGFTLLTIVLLANVPACLRGAARRNDPSVSAALFATFLFLFCLGASLYMADPREFLITDRELLLSMLLIPCIYSYALYRRKKSG